VLRDGRAVFVRSIVPADAPALVALFERLSPATSRWRFFKAGCPSAQEAGAQTQVDHIRCEAFVALDADRVVALAGFQGFADESGAELTLLVEDEYQGHGLGRQLLMELIAAAMNHGFATLLAEVLPDNERMLRLLETAGLPTLVDPYFGVLRVLMFLRR
jgi:GNAT superfamily N-acetyltransferase